MAYHHPQGQLGLLQQAQGAAGGVNGNFYGLPSNLTQEQVREKKIGFVLFLERKTDDYIDIDVGSYGSAASPTTAATGAPTTAAAKSRCKQSY